VEVGVLSAEDEDGANSREEVLPVRGYDSGSVRLLHRVRPSGPNPFPAANAPPPPSPEGVLARERLFPVTWRRQPPPARGPRCVRVGAAPSAVGAAAARRGLYQAGTLSFSMEDWMRAWWGVRLHNWFSGTCAQQIRCRVQLHKNR